jgi:hypothetical protein
MNRGERLFWKVSMFRSAIALLTLLGGCSLFPLTEADCKPASWRERGYADGFGGSHRQDMRYIPECRQRYGVEIGWAEYLAGWQDGYNEWDRLNNGMRRH